MDHIAVYGPDNDMRLTGKHETRVDRHVQLWRRRSRRLDPRAALVRQERLQGYLEDRRPNSQGDPYQIASQILKTIASVPANAEVSAAA